MTREEIKAKIQAAAPEGKITCASAFKIASDLGISRAEMGNWLDELRIKISQCQLGCF
jgi:hypothetical protein